MSEVVVRPLVVLREHAGGAFSAHPAAAPTLVCYGADREAVLAELVLFLSAYLAKMGAESSRVLQPPRPRRAFRELDKGDLRQIVRLELAKVREREGIKRRGISLTVSDEAEEILAELGWHPQFGARPLTRVIEEKVLTIAVELSRKPSLSRLDVRVERAGQELSISFRP
jgi:hypothetical protein